MTAPEAPTTALGAGPGFVVQLDAFSGPLDLLLHLLREEQLETAVGMELRSGDPLGPPGGRAR